MQLPLDIKLREDATYANYLGEAGKRLRATNGIIYVWGAPGTGRSHLLQAACHEARLAGESAIYLVGIGQHSPEVIRDLEHLELVCIDDIHEIAGNADWETALFHLINGVRDRGASLILSANKPVSELAVKLADLQSRLKAAQGIATDQLDDAGKLALLQQKAAGQGYDLAEEVGRFILSRSGRDLPTLLALLERLEIETLRRQKRVTIPLVKQVLGL